MGVGLSTLFDNIGSVETDFLDDHDIKQEKLEKTIDQIREKVGANAIGKGRGFNLEQPLKKINLSCMKPLKIVYFHEFHINN